MRHVTLAAAGMIVAMVLAAPADARSDREPVTDPLELEALGYLPGTPDIYRLKRAASDPAIVSRQLDEAAGPRAAFPAPMGGNGNTTAAGFAFFPLTHTYEYVKGPSFLIMNGGLVSLTSAGYYEAQLDLPNNSQLQWLDVFGFLNDADEPLTVTLVERCLPYLTAGNPDETVLATAMVTDEEGQFLYSRGLGQHAVDARECTYHVRARFRNVDATSPAVNMQLTKVRVEWEPDLIFVDGLEGD